MALESVILFATDPLKMLIVTASIIISLLSLLAWKKYNSSTLLYAHLFFVLSPLFYFAFSINCSLGFVKGFLSWCTFALAKLVLYGLPVMMALAFISGYILIPRLYKKISKRVNLKSFDSLCKKTGITAKLFILDKASPLAFTHKDSVFVSVGMFELLSSKELEAVMLHELYHVNSNASWNKFSFNFTKAFSPLAWYSGSNIVKEEKNADKFATHLQKTDKYIYSAKQKITF